MVAIDDKALLIVSENLTQVSLELENHAAMILDHSPTDAQVIEGIARRIKETIKLLRPCSQATRESNA